MNMYGCDVKCLIGIVPPALCREDTSAEKPACWKAFWDNLLIHVAFFVWSLVTTQIETAIFPLSTFAFVNLLQDANSCNS